MSTRDLHPGKGALSRTLSTRLAATGDLDSFARGLTDSYLPRTVQDYWTYRRYMHDILCLAFIEQGIYHNEELKLSDLGIKTNDKRLNMQKPDLYTIELVNLEVGEVLLSYNVERELKIKQEKYRDLFSLIASKRDTQINYNVIAVDLTDPEWEDKLPKLPELHIGMLRVFIDNLRYVHANTSFSSFRSETGEFYGLDKFRFELSETQIPELVNCMTQGTSTLSDLINKIESPGHEKLEPSEYVKLLAQGVLSGRFTKRPAPSPEPSDCTDLIEAWKEYRSSPPTTDKLPRILQLGSPLDFVETHQSFEEIVQELKTTKAHGGYVDMIKSYLARTDPEEGHILRLSMSEQQLHKEQLQGPGRKAALKRMGMKEDRKPPKHISVDPKHEQALDDLIEQLESTTISKQVSEIGMPDMDSTGYPMYNTLERVFDLHNNSAFACLAKFYQRASQEIVLNSMRRRKNHQYVLCTSGFKGIYFLIAPGPQLRTESNVEFVKVISMVRSLNNELSAPWHITGDHWESDWLSVDTDRLKHWARAYDRTILSNVTCAERLVEKSKSIVQCCKTEIKHGNYQLMVLTYLEDKQLTSVTNQTLRYLWMKSLGDKQFSGVMSKFPTRVGSVIQSVMLQRSIRTILFVSQRPLSDFVRVPRAKQDEQTGLYDETTTGVVGKLPRLFTKGEMVPISYNLNEIYWCMLYNKDRQNPTQDALSILSKVLREEHKFDKEIASRETSSQKEDYVLGNTSIKQDLNHIQTKNPESHYFSRAAVKAGLYFQSKHEDNMAPDFSWLSKAKLNTILTKNLSEFATFKASVKTICQHADPSDLTEIEKIGKRTKAVELVAELVKNEKLTQAFEVAMAFSGENGNSFEIMIQIFKKGQIGGVREIMILYIKARILFNIVEEVCRLLAKSDKREILTKGKDKRLMMRGDFEEVVNQFERGTPVQMVKNSYDMSTWCQKFIPTIFCSIYTEMFSEYPALKNLGYYIFLKHTNKKIEFPRRLAEVWALHPDEKHSEPWMQEAKEEFLRTGTPYFVNHSNMCQGIPHYNSTVLALSCQSLRDELFRECLRQLGKECRIRWKTRVGSDDKGDMIGIDMSSPDGYAQYLLFEQCAHAAERLHSMELSVKSAAGNIMYELNSAFMANLETLSPTIKFSSAACDMIATTSCSIFVNESYGRVRQLRENGGSSVLCGLAHILNSDHFNTMFRTGPGMTNDIQEIFGVKRSLIPYDFGVYPFYDVDLQEVVGPEFHNYLSLTSDACPQVIKQLLFTPLSKEEIGANFPTGEDALLKKDHFGIHQGLIKQLTSMRARVGVDFKDVDDFFRENPFLIVRGPETEEETLKVIQSKLLTKGASEALRRTSPAIYLGRLSAFESARAWTLKRPNGMTAFDLDLGEVFNLEEQVKVTYKEFLHWGLKMAETANYPVKETLNLIFPQASSYEIVKHFVGKFGPHKESSRKHSQAVRTWTVNSYNYNFSNSLKSILETSFGMSQLSSKEDVNEFKKLLGFDLSTYEGFIEECKRKSIRPLDLFFYMSKIYRASKVSKIQAFASGPSTGTLHNTLISIKRFSHFPNQEIKLSVGLDEVTLQKENRPEHSIDTLKFCCNLLLMEAQEVISSPVDILSSCTIGGISLRSWAETAVRSIKNISGFDHQTKKVVTYVATQVLQPDEIKEKLLSWKTLNYTYLQRQRKRVDNSGNVHWDGDLSLLVNSGNDSFLVEVVNNQYRLRANRLNEPETLLQSLSELCRLLGFNLHDFFEKRLVRTNCYFLTENGKSLIQASADGSERLVLRLHLQRQFPYLRLVDLDNFKVVTERNHKSGAVYVSLEQRGERSATVCHFPGTYYPSTKPESLTIPDEVWFKGVRLCKLLKNSDWFYNYRLPAFGEEGTVKFLKEDVNLDVVLSQTTGDKQRIVEYLQVTEEVNEEAFNLYSQQIPMAGTAFEMAYPDIDSDFDVNELFRQEIEKVEATGTFAFVPMEELVSGDWADMIEEELEAKDLQEELDEVEEGSGDGPDLDGILGNQDDGIRFIRSMGYKKRGRRANFQVISLLQQGHMLKERVLNMFFKNSSVTSESGRNLPHYYIWLNRHKEEVGDQLKNELQRIIVDELRITMGATSKEIRSRLERADMRLELAPSRLMNYLFNEEADLYTQLSQAFLAPESDYEESLGAL
uniref:RNA-directed RNA polymerase L n=1 Tax=Suillus luteus associated bunya-like virus 3 TaxID=3067798 RepID=A0AA49X7G7_9VIRU|nr:RNA-dependent RNA polymerase [Suillus luteus associated bunya-like virus 3]